ncbi:MAG: hypothetical protein VX498_11870, partial [Myxococcota bacterium]|nr:hypothetical protein [Myxococcota bacterium]
PGMPGGAAGPAVAGAKRGKKRKGPRRGGKGGGRANTGSNLPLIRNISVAVAGVVLLITVLLSIAGDKKPATSADQPGTTAGSAETSSTAARRGRTDQEILQDSRGSFETGKTYFDLWRVSDHNLAIAVKKFKSAQSDLLLVSKEKWPAFSRDLDLLSADANKQLDSEYAKIRISYNMFQQNDDFPRALQEMERVLVLVPEAEDERHKFAREKIQAVRARMSGGGSEHIWANHN